MSIITLIIIITMSQDYQTLMYLYHNNDQQSDINNV